MMMDSFHSTVMGRPEDEAPVRQESGQRSPEAQSEYRPPYSPTNGHLPRPQFNNHLPAPPALPMPSPNQGPPASPRTFATPSSYGTEYQVPPRETPSTTSYYDPTSDARERRPSDHAWRESQHTPQKREPYPSSEPPKYYTSPVTNSFAPISHSHPQRPSQSPRLPPMTSPSPRHNSLNMGGPSILHEPMVKQEPLPAASTQSRPDPMAFSSILSNNEPTPKPSPTPTAPKPRKPKTPKMESRDSSRQSSLAPAPPPTSSRVPAKRKANGEPKPKSPPKVKQLSKEQEKEIQNEIARLDAEASDIEMSEFESQRQLYEARGTKRKLDVDEAESVKSKQRRKLFRDSEAEKLGRHAGASENRYRAIHADDAITAVQEKEVAAEKERKKDMQRKRRREKTLTNTVESRDAALAKAQEADDEDTKRRLLKEAQRMEKKAQATRRSLAIGDKGGPEIRTVSPIEPNFAGGLMSTFTAVEPEPKKTKRVAGNGRLRKSKEQKQAEKDSAIAAQAAIDAGEEPLPPSADREETRIRIKFNSKDSKDGREDSPAMVAFEPFVSKGYNQIYDQIWRDMARKDVTKVHKIAIESITIKQSNLKKTAILAAKEAKRWQARTNKGTKDLQARAKRVMREMMSFWKRNEREERDTRRAAEKQEIENAKKQEADREANRQKRKLNFLISQTELYSHFIGKKIKTDEVERSTDQPDPNAPAAKVEAGPSTIKLPDGTGPAGKVTEFKDLDFDDDDESALHAAAAANAQHAIAEAQAKARAFNDDAPTMDEEGEMNFQNPSGLGDINIEQPKMLLAQLKDYQLKGLNWMVNLYEQGINGILADEMGLGKTIQSMSVMAYLAEKHNIWGPFLVVAPASTLHNWEQELKRFIPRLKTIPYWGSTADRKILRRTWDRKHIAYTEEAECHVVITSYQLVVADIAYFQKMKWQYMILDEAQAIKSSQSTRWKSLLSLHCRNRLLLTGTPIQNNMQELWALLHFIMPSLFDSHDEFSEWFSKDIESHTQSNTKLNEDQLKRLHMILKPFMLRRVKKHVQKELGDKIELDVFCDLTYRQRAYYANLRNQISIMDLIEKASVGDDNDSGTLMNLVMQFRKVCNHPDLFERAEITSPFSFGSFAQTGSFLREGPNINVIYSVQNMIKYELPRLVWREGGRLDLPGRDNEKAGFKGKYLHGLLNVFNPETIHQHTKDNEAFSWLRFSDTSANELSSASKKGIFARAVDLAQKPRRLGALSIIYDEEEDKDFTPVQAMLRIVDRHDRKPLAKVTNEGYLNKLFNVAADTWAESGMTRFEQCGRPAASAPPIEVVCSSSGTAIEQENVMFNIKMRRALYGPSATDEKAFIAAKVPLSHFPPSKMLPAPASEKQRFTNISVPSMRRFVTDSGKLAKLDSLLFKLKEGGHRVLLYFQMTRMIDLMEEYLTYRNYKYLRLDGSTKLEDRRDTVHDFQTRPEIFIFLLSTRAGGLGINLTSADTVIFYDSDWNPTIDSQAMDRAHRLGQTKQVTVYRMITRGTIEERIRKRALQKEEVQKVVMTGGSGGGVDFNTRSKENRTKDIAMWLVDDDEAAEIERKEAELASIEAAQPESKKGKKVDGRRKKKVDPGSLEDLYHEGEGHFDDGSNRPSNAATPIPEAGGKGKKRKSTGAAGGGGKKAKTAKQRLAMADGDVDMG